LYQGSKFDEFLTKKLVISAKSFGAFQYALKFESSILEFQKLQKFINHNAKAMAKDKKYISQLPKTCK
jgi:hypothetical protein